MTEIKDYSIDEVINFEISQGLIRFPGDQSLLKAGEVVDFIPWGEHWMIN